MSEALYKAVKSGRVKLEELNDEGKKALKSYITSRGSAVEQPTVKPEVSPKQPLVSSSFNEKLIPAMDVRNSELVQKSAASKPRVRIPVLDFINDKVGGAVEGASNFLNRAAITATDAITLGQTKKPTQKMKGPIGDIFRENASPADTKAEKAADIVGGLYGFTAPAMGAYATGGRALVTGLSKLAPNAPKLVQSAARGLGAGAVYGTAKEGLDEAINPDDKDAIERLKSAGLDAALFAGGDVAAGLIGNGARALVKYGKSLRGPATKELAIDNFHATNKRLGEFYDEMAEKYGAGNTNSWSRADNRRFKVIDQEVDNAVSDLKKFNVTDAELFTRTAPKEVLALPPSRRDVRIEAARNRGAMPGNETVIPAADIPANALPAGNYQRPQRLRVNDNNETLDYVMRQIKDDVQRDMRDIPIYKKAVEAAAKRGYDLPKLLEGQGSKVSDKVTRNAQERVAGVYPTEAPNIARPASFNKQVVSEAAPIVTKVGIKPRASNSKSTITPPKRKFAPTGETTTPATIQQSAVKPLNAPVQGRILPETTVPDDIPNDIFPDQPAPAEGVKQSWFQRLFGNQTMGILPGSAPGGRNTLTTEGQIVDKPIKQTARGAIEATKATGRRVYQEMVDMNNPIRKISQKAYDTSMDAARGNQLANVIVGDKFVTPEGKVIGEGLKGIVRKAGRGNYNAFTDYIIARHALTRMERGERVYADKLEMTVDKIADRIKTLEERYPGFKEIGQEWDGYFNNIREIYGVSEGLLSKELANVLKTKNPNYAPMRRQFTTEEKIKGIGYSGAKPMFSGQKAPLQEVSPTGSTRKVVDPVRTTIEQTGAWVNAALRNRVMRTIVDNVTENPEAMKNIVEIVQAPKGQKNLREILEVEGEERFLEMLQDDFNKLFKSQRLDGDNIVRAMVKGEPVYLKVKDPEAVKALMGMGAEQTNFVLKFANALSTATKFGATGALAPMFAVKSATMDLAQAIIQSKQPLRHVTDVFGALISSVANELKIPVLRNMAEDFYRTGGGYSAAMRGERGLKKGIGDMKLDPILSGRNIAKTGLKTVAAPVKALYKISDIAENLNRIAAFKGELRRLGGERTPENIQKAMNASREITTNYSRRGLQGRTIESLIPYQNAAVQGMYRFARAWKKNPVKTAALVGTTVLLPKLIEYSRFSDDPDYQKIPARERYRNIFVNKNADGTFVKLPMSPEYNSLGAFFSDLMEYYKSGDPEAFKGVTDAVVNAYTPPIVSGALQGLTQGGGIEKSLAGAFSSTVLSPAVATIANKDYAGRPIESRELEDLSPENRFNERTSEVAKYIGQKLNFSPQKTDYLLRAYGGDPARLLLPLTSQTGAGSPRNTLLKNFITDPTLTNNLSNDFYEMKTRIDRAYRDYKEKKVPLPSWFSEGLRQYVSSTSEGSLNKRLSYLRDQKTSVQANKSLSAKDKTEKIRDIQEKMNNIYIDVNAKMREKGVPVTNR